ncbi:MAG: hypothetical protein AUK63_1724 [bacterium P3]|nr:MAG: hypothetical protein AUK63_1724 [bacterium P3]KWW38720.1 MAG: hypothetical protein F083_2174 [bacterium F083]
MRNNIKRSLPPKFIIYVEGRNTEPSYFNLLKRANAMVYPIKIHQGKGIGSCIQFVEDAEGHFNSLNKEDRIKYKQKWLVFDYDGHEDFPLAIKKAREDGFHVAFSSMCIEYWFLLHFINHDGTPIPLSAQSHSKAQIDRLNAFIDKYNKKNPQNRPIEQYDTSKEVKDDLFDLMLSEDSVTHNRRIIDAYRRAKKIHLSKKTKGAEFSESVTTIYELLKELGVILDDGESISINIM